MNDGHVHDMGGMAAPPRAVNDTCGMMMPHHKMMMHSTFFWGKNVEILFSGWPGTRTGMYILALVVVFLMGFLVEWLSHSRPIKPRRGNVVARIIQSLVHTIRVVVAYMLMLAIMSFNVGVFIAAVAGHAIGFFLFGTRVFEKTEIPRYEKTSDLLAMDC